MVVYGGIYNHGNVTGVPCSTTHHPHYDVPVRFLPHTIRQTQSHGLMDGRDMVYHVQKDLIMHTFVPDLVYRCP